MLNMIGKKVFNRSLLVLLLVPVIFQVASGETVTGNGYSIQQIISPVNQTLSGNGYNLNQSAQPLTGFLSATGFSLSSGLGSTPGVSAPSTSPAPTPTPSPSSSGSNGGGFYVLPPSVTGVWSATTSTSTQPIPPVAIVPSTNPGTILTENGSTCSTRVTFSSPIDITIENNINDVKKLEVFLNTYEGEKLPVNGIYEKVDVEAVKRWQLKYKTFILDPMRLKQPTGTIYTLSQRQIERQTTSTCGVPIVVTACPFFRANVSYGDRGEDVKKVQQFLNIVQGERLPLSGVFGPLTKAAVKRFQKSYRIYVSTFIPVSIATGNWYTTTRVKANETIGCDILK